MVYSMYKPVAEDDRTTICALMKLYKIYYRVIGLVVLVGGLILCPFIPKLISDELPAGMNVYILYANGNMKIILFDDGNLEKIDAKSWIAGNGWWCEVVSKDETTAVNWLIEDKTQGVLIVR